MENSKAKYGLPEEVKFCKRCVISNQRPASTAEFRHTPDSKKVTIHFDDDGICDGCRAVEQKDLIDWKDREDQLLMLLEKHRSPYGDYDCIVPGSGGKDSVYQAHILKHKYGMHPLTVTWAPIMYTDYGYRNWKRWIDAGFDNETFTPNGQVMKLLTRLSIENLLHPFQTFMLGQKNVAPKMALKHNIPLIFYGENEAEYGNPIADNATSLRDKSLFSWGDAESIHLAGVPVKELMEAHGLNWQDIRPFLPPHAEHLERSNIEVHYLGYYLRWVPQEAYYYAVEHTGFEARPERSQGTYSKYNSIDDKIDDLHYYTTFIKFGIGRATYDAAQEIRNRHITREEGIALVRRFDGEFPNKYFNEIMEYIGMRPERFHELCEQFKSPHLWDANGLKHRVQ